ncbi:MAG: lipoyl(octanoyl) transferase LipB, partial [Candidatus Sericytochromatia bacterium]
MISQLDVIDLGLKDYKETLEFQYQCLDKRLSNEINDTLIFVEHPHTITMGKKSSESNILDKSLPIYQVERGGDVTYHGLGQLVGYPIININEKKDIGKFLRNIEEALILTLREYNLDAVRKDKHTG